MLTTMTHQELIERLSALAAEQVSADVAGITADTHLFNDLGFDSLEAVEYTMTIEDTFEVSIPDEQAVDAKTIGQVADMLLPLLR